MNDEQQDIAIWKALGWEENEPWINGTRCFERVDTACGFPMEDLPRCGSDLNAAAFARDQLITTPELRIKWVNQLRAVRGRRCRKNKAGHAIVSDVDLLFADAPELRETLIKTLNLWIEPNVPTSRIL
jgi:hypothetical protein